MATIDIIVPVYAGYSETRACLESVLAAPASAPYRLLVINDASPEPDLVAYLRRLSEENAGLVYMENETNLGFVGTVNRGLAEGADNDVVILNSDTEVAGDWLGRLFQTAYCRTEIGTVTPFSNNATICSFPECCESNELPEGRSVQEVDAAFAAANWGRWYEIPTGVGFCMYLKRACVDSVGLLDEETFGRGYGEENDFCRRAVEKGWMNALAADVFVYHAGSVSFGEEKEALAEAALKTLERLHPDYLREVHRFIALDPPQAARIRAWLELLRASRLPNMLMVSHGIGGGTGKHVYELADAVSGQANVLVLESTPADSANLYLPGEKRWERLEFDLPADYEDLIILLRYLEVGSIHFHHLQDVHPCVIQAPSDLGVWYDITLHDYYFINANPTLADADGNFCGGHADFDDCCATARPIPQGLTPTEWRERNQRFLSGARRVIAPSQYALDIHREFFSIENGLVVPHPDWNNDYPYPSPVPAERVNGGGRKPTVLVVGALNKEKGADVLEAVARASRKRGDEIEFHLLGYAYRPLASAVIQHGPYADEDVDCLIEQIEPDIIWFPALWPETYSYTLSAALRAGRPIIAPDLGAFPERVAGRPLTWVVSWKSSVEEWLRVFEEACTEINTPGSHEWAGQPSYGRNKSFYAESYVTETAPDGDEAASRVLQEGWVERFVVREEPNSESGRILTPGERLLYRIARWREHPMLRPVARLVPFGLQRGVKRLLSPRPLHEVVIAGHSSKEDGIRKS